MKRSRTVSLICTGSAALLALAALRIGFCGEPVQPPGPPGDAERGRAAQVLQKLLNGQPLTDEERVVAVEIKGRIAGQMPAGAEQPRAADPAAQAVAKLIDGQVLTVDEKAMAQQFAERLNAPPGGDFPPGGMDRQRMRELMQKVRDGQPLTDEERALVDQFRDRTRGRGGPGADPAFRPNAEAGLVWAEDRMNIVDQARFETARLHYKNQRYQDAAQILTSVVEQSPDKFAVAAAHMDLGTLNRRGLKKLDKAIEEYGKVEGELCVAAAQEVAATYQELGQWEKAIEVINQLKARADRQQQTQLLRQQADLYSRNGQDDKAIETLKKIPELVTYAEAQEWRKEGPATGRPVDLQQQFGRRRGQGPAGPMPAQIGAPAQAPQLPAPPDGEGAPPPQQ